MSTRGSLLRRLPTVKGLRVFSIRPATSRFLKRFRGRSELFQVANSVVELEPGSAFETLPAICLGGELERVTGFLGDESTHRRRIAGGLRTEGPTLAYRFDRALLADFTAYAAGSYQVYRKSPKRPFLLGHADHYDEAQICTSVCAQVYFGHFFHDSLVLEELAARRKLSALTFSQKPWLHEHGYRQLFERHAIPVSTAHVDRLWVVDERNLNEGWRSRFAALRSRLRKKVTSTGARKVFITRGALYSGRCLANESALAELLEHHGFRILEPEHEDPATIASTLCGAGVIVCVAGSAELHALMAACSGATLIEIQIAEFFTSIGKTLSEAADIRWGYVVAEKEGGQFVLPPKRLLETLDLI